MVQTVAVVAGALRHGIRPGQRLMEAAQVFLDNVAEHAPGAPPPVVCAAFEPESKTLQLVTINLAPAGVALPASDAELKQMLTDPDKIFRSLSWLTRRISNELELALNVSSGAAHARHRAGRGWMFAPAKQAVPGFVAGIEIRQ